jgi:hypothetical protein
MSIGLSAGLASYRRNLFGGFSTRSRSIARFLFVISFVATIRGDFVACFEHRDVAESEKLLFSITAVLLSLRAVFFFFFLLVAT